MPKGGELPLAALAKLRFRQVKAAIQAFADLNPHAALRTDVS